MRTRLVVFVDHEIGYRLLKKIIAGRDHYAIDLVAVVTTKDNGKQWWPGVADVCAANKLDLFVYEEPFSATIQLKNIDWYFLLSWKYIIPSELIEHPIRGAINMHYSLLPQDRGVYPVNWAIIQGRVTTGVTFHRVVEKFDEGAILFQRPIRIALSDTARSLQLKMDDVAFELFDEVLEWTTRDTQIDPMVSSKDVTPTSNLRKKFDALRELDLDKTCTVRETINLLRGMSFFASSRNIYVVDPETGKRVYFTISTEVE